jgi:CDP-2,3-bis-(O-geranylgeranyl)-sn-glycerol synthase
MTGPDDPIFPTALATALWLLLPAGAANMAPVIAAWCLPSWSLPVDLGYSLGGKRVFGSHKTWRGMVAGALAGSLVFLVQQRVIDAVPVLQVVLSDLGRGQFSPLFGAWIGLGALCGDLVKSLAKRRLAIPPGRSWFPFDQIDWLLGALAFAAPFLPLSAGTVLAVLLVGLGLHLVCHAFGRALGLNRSWI